MSRIARGVAFGAALALVAPSPVLAQGAGAPDDALFGAQHLSPRGIALTIGAVQRRLALEPAGTASLLATLRFADDALRDWERRYPGDPRIAADRRALGAAFAGVPNAEPPAAPALPPLATAPGVSLRHLEYALTREADGRRASGVVAAEIVNVAGGALTIDVSETLADGARAVVRARVDQRGGIRAESGALSDEQEALLTALSLSSEDMDGVDPGDTWERRAVLDDGRHVTRYTVKTATPKLQTIGFERAVTRADGSIASWRGSLSYDPAAAIPVAIALDGRQSRLENVELQDRTVKLTLQLAADSFRH